MYIWHPLGRLPRGEPAGKAWCHFREGAGGLRIPDHALREVQEDFGYDRCFPSFSDLQGSGKTG